MSEPIYSPGLEGVIAGETAISTVTGGLQLPRLFDRGPRPARHVRGSRLSAAVRRAADAPSSWTSFASGSSAAAQVPPADHRRRCARFRRPPPAWTCSARRAACSPTGIPIANDNSHEANVRKAERLLAQLPVVMAARHRLKQGKEPVPAESGRSLAANCSVHAVPRRPVARPHQGDGRVADSLRRARVQRLDVHRPRDRLDAVRLALGDHRRDRRAEGPAARRGEREGDGRAAAGRQEGERRERGFATRSPARKRSWASAIASTRTAIRGPCT